MDHTDLKGGFAKHKPGSADPSTNGCTQCHGPNLNDGFANSCFSCHGPVWEGTDGHHMPGRDQPWTNCTTCHGSDLRGGVVGVACVDCHNSFSPPDAPPPGHHMPGRGTPRASNCTACHGDDLKGGIGPSCLTCHDKLWADENTPPEVKPGGPYTGVVGKNVQFDGSATVDADDDPLTFRWDFGDGSPPTAPSADPKATHTYASRGTYTAVLTVSDGTNDPVSKEVAVTISDSAPPPGDRWRITVASSPAEVFTMTCVKQGDLLIAIEDDGIHSATFAIGIEFSGVIFWMDYWLDVRGNVSWGAGDIYIGNIDRGAGRMAGVVFGGQGGVFTFSGTRM